MAFEKAFELYKEKVSQSGGDAPKLGWRVETLKHSERNSPTEKRTATGNSLHPPPRGIYLNPDQEPPADLLNELFAMAADIRTRRAVLSPNPGAMEPLKWDRDQGQYLFNPRQ